MNFKIGAALGTSILLAIAAFNGVQNNSPAVDLSSANAALFEEWKLKFGKVYAKSEEQKFRLTTFANNLEVVKKLSTSSLGLTAFSDLTTEEMKVKYFNYVPTEDVRVYKKQETLLNSNLGQAPDAVDYRTKGILNPVVDQEECGNSYAYSAVTSIEALLAQDLGKLLKLSVQRATTCSTTRFGNYGCGGGTMEGIFKLAMRYGLTENEKTPCDANNQDARVTSFFSVNPKTSNITPIIK